MQFKKIEFRVFPYFLIEMISFYQKKKKKKSDLLSEIRVSSYVFLSSIHAPHCCYMFRCIIRFTMLIMR